MLLVLKLPKGSRIPQKGFETAKVQITSQIHLTATCYHCVSMLSHFSCVPLFVTPWTAAHQAPLSIEFSRQEYWSGFSFSIPRIFLTQESNLYVLRLLHWQVDSLPQKHQGSSLIVVASPIAESRL